MLAALLRLFALRPFLTMAILGIPIIVLIAIGLFTVLAVKLLLFVVLPAMLVFWLLGKIFRSDDGAA